MLLLRHAESEWNRVFGATRVDAALPDPGLTPEGEAAAREAARALGASPDGRGLVRILASPYRRTLRTAALVAEVLRLPVGVEPLVRERCAFSCDQGSSPADLAREWPDLDFAGLEGRWWGRLIESMEGLERRAARFLEGARDLPDRDGVLVVTHWGFIRCVTGREVGNLAAVRLPFDPPPPPPDGAEPRGLPR